MHCIVCVTRIFFPSKLARERDIVDLLLTLARMQKDPLAVFIAFYLLIAGIQYALIYYPVFASLTSDHAIGYTLGTIYTWTLATVFVLNQCLCRNGSQVCQTQLFINATVHDRTALRHKWSYVAYDAIPHSVIFLDWQCPDNNSYRASPLVLFVFINNFSLSTDCDYFVQEMQNGKIISAHFVVSKKWL